MTKSSLLTAMSKAAARAPQLGRAEISTSSPELHSEDQKASNQVRNAANPKPQRPPGRVGKKVISGFFDAGASKQLSRLAIDQERTKEELLREALNDLFTKYQLPPIA